MSKYNPLSDRLTAHPNEEWRTSFSELESVLGFALPKAARAGRAWWANDPDRSHSRAWTLRGWTVDDVDHAAERVVFRRGGATAPVLEVQAPVVSETAPPKTPAPKAVRVTAMVAAGAAVALGLGAMLARAVMRRSK